MKTTLILMAIPCLGLFSPQQWNNEAISTVAPSLRALPLRPADHDFHVSKCLVEYNEGEQSLQISLHLFIDDLEEALRRQGADKLFICTKKEAPRAESHIFQYLRKHFSFEADGQKREYTFIGKEVSEDLMAAWCYLEIAGVKKLETLKVSNSLLMEVFDDQKNLVSITGPGRKQGLLMFQKGDTVKTAKF